MGLSNGFMALMERVTFNRIPEVEAPLPFIQVQNTSGLFGIYISMLTLAIVVLLVERWFSSVKKSRFLSVGRHGKHQAKASVKIGTRAKESVVPKEKQQSIAHKTRGKSAPARK